MQDQRFRSPADKSSARRMLAVIVAAVALLGWSSADRASTPTTNSSHPSILSTEIAVGSFELLVRVSAY